MRWRFHDPSDPHEKAEHDRVVRLIDTWWAEFATRTADIDALFNQRKQWDLPAWMDQYLHAVDPRICWEFGPATRGEGHRLVITPESEKQLRPIVETIIERAPSLPGWEFYPYRLAGDLEEAEPTVQGRCGGSLQGFMVRASIGEQNLIDLVYHSPRATSEEDQQALTEAFIGTEALLGEELLDKWIGAIEARPLAKPGLLSKLMGRGKAQQNLIPLERLRPTVEALVGSIRDQLPDRPYHQIDVKADGHPWATYTLKPQEQEDYPARSDLLVGVTSAQALTLSAHGPRFCSERFSRFGETFCYLKIDGSKPPEHLRDREVIENAADEAILPRGLGRVIGGGTGMRYSYVDLALGDAEGAVPTLRAAMQKLGLPRRSWLLFYDPDLADEWVGIYPDTPAPPMATSMEP